ncbi:class I SAM-dependent methyltransferase [Flavimaribacter sediminis]|uniref:class I SAM-dependent methyltransferase n=1 Tax=Flavimaribacter sediminis TaxID=2865987 RepID=UPI00351E10DC
MAPERNKIVKDRRQFILENTGIVRPPHVPEIALHVATEAFDLWYKTEEELEAAGLPPPYWAFAWAGGQGLARYVLDNPDCVAGLSVLDFASGSGLVAIAAAMAGAKTVTACEIDAWACEAMAINAALNGVTFDIQQGDIAGTDGGWDVILAGDVFYEKAMADRLAPWFATLAARGARVLIGDPKRAYCPVDRLTLLATSTVPVSRELEDQEIKNTNVWRFS